MTAPGYADPPGVDQPAAGALVFVDSNVLLYALDEADPNKQKIAQNLACGAVEEPQGTHQLSGA